MSIEKLFMKRVAQGYVGPQMPGTPEWEEEMDLPEPVEKAEEDIVCYHCGTYLDEDDDYEVEKIPRGSREVHVMQIQYGYNDVIKAVQEMGNAVSQMIQQLEQESEVDPTLMGLGGGMEGYAEEAALTVRDLSGFPGFLAGKNLGNVEYDSQTVQDVAGVYGLTYEQPATAMAQALLNDPQTLAKYMIDTGVARGVPVQEHENKYVCDDCAGKEECYNCEDRFDEEDLTDSPDGDKYCDDCRMDSFEICENCGDPVWMDESHWIEHESMTMCQDCAVDWICEECKQADDETYEITVDEYDKRICEGCLGNYTRCAECDHYYSDTEGGFLTEYGEWMCSDCAHDHPNIISFETVKQAHYSSRIDVTDDMQYFKEQYPGLYQMPEGLNRRKRKQWDYVQNWLGGFNYIPEMNVEVTKPSTDYDGTYIEFHVTARDLDNMAAQAGMDENTLYGYMGDFNSYARGKPCLVSGDAERMIVMRVETMGNQWNVKLMQGSVNQEARKDASAKGSYEEREQIEYDLKELNRRYNQLERVKSEVRRQGNQEEWQRMYDAQAKISRWIDEMRRKLHGLPSMPKDHAKGIVAATNGAYVAAYDWISRLAKSQGASLYTEVPLEQASQHPDAPEITLEMVYGAIPFLMGFETVLETRGPDRKPKKKHKLARRRFISMWDLPLISRIGGDGQDSIEQRYLRRAQELVPPPVEEQPANPRPDRERCPRRKYTEMNRQRLEQKRIERQQAIEQRRQQNYAKWQEKAMRKQQKEMERGVQQQPQQ